MFNASHVQQRCFTENHRLLLKRQSQIFDSSVKVRCEILFRYLYLNHE